MDQILLIRDYLISFEKRYEVFIVTILKFLVGFMVFSLVNDLGYSRPEFAFLFKPPYDLTYKLVLALAFTVMPLTFGFTIMMLNIVIMFSAFIEISAFIFVALSAIIFLYVRLAPKESAIILVTLFAFYFKLPFFVPLFAGMYMGLTSIIPITIGIFLWTFYPVVFTMVNDIGTAGMNFLDWPGILSQIYKLTLSTMSINIYWVFTAFIFALVVVAVYAISRLSLNHSRDMGLGMGFVVILISSFLPIAPNHLNTGLLEAIFGAVLCYGFVRLIMFFDLALDYSRVEYVQFQDNDNYYYVKVVPKILAPKKRKPTRQQPVSNFAHEDSE